jgi:hypothetical protein
MTSTSSAGDPAAQPRTSVSIALVGSGGAGVMTAGNMLLEAAAHAGYYALMTRSSGPQIRGGEAAAMVRIATRPVECMEDCFHVLAAVDWENVHRFGAEIPLSADALIVGDPDAGEPHETFTGSGRRDRRTLPARAASSHAQPTLAAHRQRGRRLRRDQGWRALRGRLSDHAGHRVGREHQVRGVAVQAVKRDVDVTLLGLGRDTSGRADAHHVHHDDGGLGRDRETERLDHEREPRA